jgi:SAM-dependent methyltransferase
MEPEDRNFFQEVILAPYFGVVGDDTWAGLADQFADEAYASVKGRVRTYVLHQQLLEHLAAPPVLVLDVGGGAGHQSFPLAQAGYDVTLLDPSQAMLDKAQQRLEGLPSMIETTPPAGAHWHNSLTNGCGCLRYPSKPWHNTAAKRRPFSASTAFSPSACRESPVAGPH